MDLEQKLIKWFNNKIDYFENQCNNDHMIKLIRSNEFQFKCNNIWKQLQPLRALIYDTLNVQNQQTSSSSSTDWIKIVLILNYRSIWLKILFKTFVRQQYGDDDDDKDENLLRKIFQIFIDYDDDDRKRCTNLIAMIYWLDHARLELTEMIIHPCLFRKWPQSSEKILDNFLRQTFYPEQWQRLKFRLKQSSSSSTSFKLGHHEQQFHHSNFHIEQLSIDLSNGIRLARIIQLLFPEKFSIALLSKMKPGKDMDNVRKLFEQCHPIFHCYDSKFEWNAENALAIARNYRQQTLETLQSLMRIEFNLLIEKRYCLYLKQIVFIQRFIRCRNETRRLRNEFLLLRKSTITIQRWYRSKIAARKQRSNYNRIRQATIIIQRWFRCRRNIIICRNYVEKFLIHRQKAALTIQRFWFGYRCRRQIYNKYPLLEIISINLKNLKQKPSTIIITIGMKSEKILKRMEKLTKNSMINNHRMISDQFINDLNDLYRFTKYSFEIRYRLLQQWQIIIQWWIDLLKCINRSEQHKMIAFYIVSIFLNLQKISSISIQSSDQLITALIHIMYNHFNYPSLLTNSLYLINGLIDQNPDLIKQLSIDPKWKRLTNRIEGRYLQPLKMNNIVGGGQQINQDSEQQQQCDECGIIQIIIKQIINKL